MTVNRYYNMCRGGVGRPVRIRTFDGRHHVGIIERVTPQKVFLRPMGRGRNYGGFGYAGVGYGWGLGWGIAIGAIAALAFLPYFWW